MDKDNRLNQTQRRKCRRGWRGRESETWMKPSSGLKGSVEEFSKRAPEYHVPTPTSKYSDIPIGILAGTTEGSSWYTSRGAGDPLVVKVYRVQTGRESFVCPFPWAVQHRATTLGGRLPVPPSPYFWCCILLDKCCTGFMRKTL
eukprot:1861095-Rhodomonas_salina.2